MHCVRAVVVEMHGVGQHVEYGCVLVGYVGLVWSCRVVCGDTEYDEQAQTMPILQLQHCILHTFWNQQ